MHARLLPAILFGVSLSVAAQQTGPTPPPAPRKSVSELLLDDIVERSPAGRYQKKDYLPGVRLLRDSKRCSAADVVNLFRLQEDPQQIRIPGPREVFTDKQPNERTKNLSITVADLESTLLTELMRMMQLFADDPAVNRREFYVTVAEFPTPNAVSVGLGFLVFDPQLFFQIVGHEQTNGWSIRAVVAHEFAHQLQYWHDEPLLARTLDGKLYSRDKELQADAVAAAMLTRLRDEGLTSDRKADDADQPFSLALAMAFLSLGDFALAHADHHGTAYERSLMVEYGHVIAGALSVLKDRSSRTLLAHARSKIEAMNAKFGDTLWPIGSRL
jgi:hypothetical protein